MQVPQEMQSVFLISSSFLKKKKDLFVSVPTASCYSYLLANLKYIFYFCPSLQCKAFMCSCVHQQRPRWNKAFRDTL